MKKFFILLIVLGVALFATNPNIEIFYQKALREELNVGDEWFAKAKYTLVDAKYNYQNFYVCGLMRNKLNDDIHYIGLFNQVIKIK